MSSFVITLTGISCDHPNCSAEFRASDKNSKTAPLVRQAARSAGWTAGRHSKAKVTPRIYDACPRHTVPPEYAIKV